MYCDMYDLFVIDRISHKSYRLKHYMFYVDVKQKREDKQQIHISKIQYSLNFILYTYMLLGINHAANVNVYDEI